MASRPVSERLLVLPGQSRAGEAADRWAVHSDHLCIHDLASASLELVARVRHRVQERQPARNLPLPVVYRAVFERLLVIADRYDPRAPGRRAAGALTRRYSFSTYFPQLPLDLLCLWVFGYKMMQMRRFRPAHCRLIRLVSTQPIHQLPALTRSALTDCVWLLQAHQAAAAVRGHRQGVLVQACRGRR